MSIGQRSLDTQELLGRLREGTSSPEEKERLLMAMDALQFISSMGLARDFEAYREDLEANGPPLVIAAFDTREEADAWLKHHPNPPAQAYVLIAGEYHIVMFIPDINHRRLVFQHILEYYLEQLVHDGLPAPVATFATREEAEAWLHAQPEPPRQVLIRIGGEDYLAAYHHRVNLRALYPVSRAAKSVQRDEPGA